MEAKNPFNLAAMSEEFLGTISNINWLDITRELICSGMLQDNKDRIIIVYVCSLSFNVWPLVLAVLANA